ncbi:S41 family peptidase [Planomonospora algeriensis]
MGAVPPRPAPGDGLRGARGGRAGQPGRPHLRAGHREAAAPGDRLGHAPGPRADHLPRGGPRGPLVAVTDHNAGSDGDIVTAAFKIHKLGPVVGTRTWGGVIGIEDGHRLVDGTSVTVPRYSFWFEGLGWGVENHGVDPDVEVDITPDDWAAGRDPQIEEAVRLALAALAERPAATPPDVAARPSRRRPALPPRP